MFGAIQKNKATQKILSKKTKLKAFFYEAIVLIQHGIGIKQIYRQMGKKKPQFTCIYNLEHTPNNGRLKGPASKTSSRGSK